MPSYTTTLNWELIRTLYTLVNEGTIAKTARILNVHPSTISRRIAELEKNTGARLVRKKGGVYISTTDGENVYEKAQIMAEQAAWFERYRENSANEVSGTVRITSIESFVMCCLLPYIPELRQHYPNLNFEFINSDSNLSFNKREMDLAIRFSKPSLMNIVSMKLGNVGFALYASSKIKRDWSNYHLQEIDWISYDEDYYHLKEAQWLTKKMKKPEPVIKSINAGTLKTSIGAGLGVGVLPCYSGDTDNNLVCISGDKPVISREAWLLIHTDYRSNPKTVTVIDWIKAVFDRDRDLISGSK